MSTLTGKPSIDRPWLKYYTKEAVDAEIPEMTVYDYLKQQNKNLNRCALNYFDRKITYGEMFEKIDETMCALLNAGVKKGDIVSIVAPTLPEVVYTFYALSRIGAVANMIDPRKSSKEIEEYVKEVDSKLLFIVDVASEKVRHIKENTSVEDIVLMSPADSLPAPLKIGYKAQNMIKNAKQYKNSFARSGEYCSWNEFVQKGKCFILNHLSSKYEKDSPVVIVHTGGTTGKAKGALLSNENFNAAALQCILAGYDFKPEHNWLDIMPPFIAYGLGNGLHLPLVCGMEVILIPQFDPEKFADLMNKYKPNHMTGVPSHFEHLIDHPKMKKADLSYVIAPTVGGDKMIETLEKRTNEFLMEHHCSYQVVKGYGMTEVNAAVAACTSNETNAIGSVGIPFPKTIISIFDPETGEELNYYEKGEICITGPNTMLGYYQNQKETEKILRMHKDGKIWVHSGDLGYMTTDGMLYIVDRIKKMIIRSDGFKVSPSDIEQVLSLHDAVESCCVVGVGNLEYRGQGQIPFANVVLKENYKLYEYSIREELFILCQNHLAEYAQPAYIHFCDALPLTPIGKVDYLTLQKGNEKSLLEQQYKQVKRLTKAK